MAQKPLKFDLLLKAMRSHDAQKAEDAFFTVESNLDYYLDEIIDACVESECPSVLSWLFELLVASNDPSALNKVSAFIDNPNAQISRSAQEWLKLSQVKNDK